MVIMGKRVDVNKQDGFSLIELISILIIVGVITVSLTSRFGAVSRASIQASRDDIIAALFFAQQTSMARDTISIVITSSDVSVKENGTDIRLSTEAYPLSFPPDVTATPITFLYDRLGHTTAGTISLSNSAGASTTITVEASGYVH